MSDSLARLTAALADRYRVTRELDAGGMATKYLAAPMDVMSRHTGQIKKIRESATGACYSAGRTE